MQTPVSKKSPRESASCVTSTDSGIKGRNGEVDLMRVFMALVIMLLHARYFWRMKNPPFSHGNYAVDFFFILSGLLMARSIAAGRANDTFVYLKRKIASFYPVFAASILIAGACLCAAKRMSLFEALLYMAADIYEFLLVRASGLVVAPMFNGAGWYLSAMVIAMAILHPVAVKARKWFFPVGSALLAAVCYGILWKNTGAVLGKHLWTGFCFYRMLRAIAGISLGVFLFEMSARTRASVSPTDAGHRLFQSVKAALIVAFAVILFNPPIGPLRQLGQMAGFFCLLLFSAYLYLVFSGLAETKCFHSDRFRWCGPASLYIYLNHVAALHLLDKSFVRHGGLPVWKLFALFFGGTIATGLACAALVALLRHLARTVPSLLVNRNVSAPTAID